MALSVTRSTVLPALVAFASVALAGPAEAKKKKAGEQA